MTELPLLPTLEPVLPARIAAARARFAAKAEPAQPSSTPIVGVDSVQGEVGVTSAALSTCRTTAQMEAEGLGYVNSATWLSPTNLDRANTKCVGRKVPASIVTAYDPTPGVVLMFDSANDAWQL